jgi:hypothetical protein
LRRVSTMRHQCTELTFPVRNVHRCLLGAGRTANTRNNAGVHTSRGTCAHQTGQQEARVLGPRWPGRHHRRRDGSSNHGAPATKSLFAEHDFSRTVRLSCHNLYSRIPCEGTAFAGSEMCGGFSAPHLSLRAFSHAEALRGLQRENSLIVASFRSVPSASIVSER